VLECVKKRRKREIGRESVRAREEKLKILFSFTSSQNDCVSRLTHLLRFEAKSLPSYNNFPNLNSNFKIPPSRALHLSASASSLSR